MSSSKSAACALSQTAGGSTHGRRRLPAPPVKSDHNEQVQLPLSDPTPLPRHSTSSEPLKSAGDRRNGTGHRSGANAVIRNTNSSSFTAASIVRREVSRTAPSNFSNRSYNNVPQMAADFRRKLHQIADANTQYLTPSGAVVPMTALASSATIRVADGSGGEADEDKHGPGRDMKEGQVVGCSPSEMMRQLSTRLKIHVHNSLSDPLREGGALRRVASVRLIASAREASGDGVTARLGRSSSMKRKVANSNRFQQLPRFFADNEAAEQSVVAVESVARQCEEIDGDSELSSDESDDPEYLELREREQIVDKYERGPDQKDVDPWENPDFELYRITDRYGFVHKQGPSHSLEDAERRRIEKELRRESKWLKMVEEWRNHHPSKLPERIWKGVPEKLRLVIWKRLLGAEMLRDGVRKNLYAELLMRARLVSKDIKQIDLDINRTYRDNLAFRRRYDVKQQSLFNVLSAYAMYNTEVGYCQGMSQIAAIFLMYMDEEDAFWCLHSLMANRRFAMHGFFVPGFPKLQRFQHHYEKVIQRYLPAVKKHLERAGIPSIYLTKWWFGCFLDRVPFSLALRVWDVFLYYGDCILIPMAYNIMKLHRKRILRLDMETFMEFIQSTLANDFGYSDDKVMESLQECLKRLQNERMALPPPPNPDAQPELPTKPLGPILTRSMIDIRMDIAEIQSRASRANSLAARSPAMKRHNASGRRSPLPPTPHTPSNTSISNPPAIGGGSPSRSASQTPLTNASNTNNVSSSSPTIKEVPAEVFARSPSIKGRKLPPPVPDADGFVPISPRQGSLKRSPQKVQSLYDNVIASSLPSAAGEATSTNTQTNGSPLAALKRHPQQDSIKRNAVNVHRAANNVTVVAVGGGGFDEPAVEAPSHQTQQRQQFYPPPDYEKSGEPGTATESSISTQGYSRRTYGNWTKGGSVTEAKQSSNEPRLHSVVRNLVSARSSKLPTSQQDYTRRANSTKRL